MNPLLGGDLAAWIGDGFALAALAGLVLQLLTMVAVLRRPGSWPKAAPSDPVTVLAPLCGAEAGLYDRLAALCRQVYAGPVQFVFGVSSASDPAIGVARQLVHDFPAAAIDLVVDPRIHGSNRKISNLVNMLEHARHDTLVFIDSDIVVAPGHLTRLVAELRREGTGAVTCLYTGVAREGRWAALSSMNINFDFLPNAILGLWLRMAEPCFGATIAISRPLLDSLGGLAAFKDCLHDDNAIGAAVRGAGQRVDISSLVVGHVCLERSSKELLQTQLRRARTIRMIDPAGYAGSVLTHPPALALIAALLGSPLGLPMLAAAIALRLIECVSIERTFQLPRQKYLNLLARDVLAFGIYLTAFFGDEVVWRGSRYRTSGRGTLVADS